MTVIVISGIVFMHKEVTSKGEIITHIHPYDFTKQQQHQHKSDSEIHYLDVLFHGNFIKSDFITFEAPIIPEFTIYHSIGYVSSTQIVALFYSFLRGPPTLV
nr:hypothetical protein [Sphingobacterium bovistauri]